MRIKPLCEYCGSYLRPTHHCVTEERVNEHLLIRTVIDITPRSCAITSYGMSPSP